MNSLYENITYSAFIFLLSQGGWDLLETQIMGDITCSYGERSLLRQGEIGIKLWAVRNRISNQLGYLKFSVHVMLEIGIDDIKMEFVN